MNSLHRTASTIALALLLMACSKVTMDNYNKLRTGQTYEEVQTVLGKPDSCDDLMGVKNCTWRAGKGYVNVSFVSGKVILFGAENLN